MTFCSISIWYIDKTKSETMFTLEKKQKIQKEINGVMYEKVFVQKPKKHKKTKEDTKKPVKPVRDQIRSEIMGEFSQLGRYKVS